MSEAEEVARQMIERGARPDSVREAVTTVREQMPGETEAVIFAVADCLYQYSQEARR